MPTYPHGTRQRTPERESEMGVRGVVHTEGMYTSSQAWIYPKPCSLKYRQLHIPLGLELSHQATFCVRRFNPFLMIPRPELFFLGSIIKTKEYNYCSGF